MRNKGNKMKKIIILVTALTFGVFTIASAELGLRVGAQLSTGYFETSAQETEEGLEKSRERSGASVVGWGSLFVEKTLGSTPLSLGINYVPTSLESETAETARTDRTSASADTAVTNKVQVDFEDLTTFYLMLDLPNNLYVKGGIAQVDLVTNEKLGTGGQYGNASLDGTVYAVGWNRTADNGIFVRAEAQYMNFEGVTLSNTGTRADGEAASTITADEINGFTGSVSLGKAF